MTGRLLSPAEVSHKLGISVVTLWRMERRKDFPAGFRIGKRAKRWREEDVDRFIANKMVAA